MEKGEKRETIIQAALELIGEHGFHGAPMATIAEKAGVGAGTIYRYFDSKDTLITEIHKMVEERFVEAVMNGYPELGSVRERYLHMGAVLVRHLMSAPLELRFIEQFHNSPYGVAHRREKLFGNKEKNVIMDLFEEARQQQIFKDLDLPILCALSFAPWIEACRDHVLGFVNLTDTLIDQTVAACWDAVRR